MNKSEYQERTVIGECMQGSGNYYWITQLVELADEKGNKIEGTGLLVMDTVGVGLAEDNNTIVYEKPKFKSIDDVDHLIFYQIKDFFTRLSLPDYTEADLLNDEPIPD